MMYFNKKELNKPQQQHVSTSCPSFPRHTRNTNSLFNVKNLQLASRSVVLASISTVFQPFFVQAFKPGGHSCGGGGGGGGGYYGTHGGGTTSTKEWVIIMAGVIFVIFGYAWVKWKCTHSNKTEDELLISAGYVDSHGEVEEVGIRELVDLKRYLEGYIGDRGYRGSAVEGGRNSGRDSGRGSLGDLVDLEHGVILAQGEGSGQITQSQDDSQDDDLLVLRDFLLGFHWRGGFAEKGRRGEGTDAYWFSIISIEDCQSHCQGEDTSITFQGKGFDAYLCCGSKVSGEVQVVNNGQIVNGQIGGAQNHAPLFQTGEGTIPLVASPLLHEEEGDPLLLREVDIQSSAIIFKWTETYLSYPWTTTFEGKLVKNTVVSGPSRLSLRGSFKTSNGSVGKFSLRLQKK